MNALILIVEDNKGMIEAITLQIEKDLKGATVASMSFKDAPEFVKRHLPDLIILDLFDAGIEQEPAAGPTWTTIWDHHFCPVVIHSAKDVAEYRAKEHPYVRYEQKNDTSIGRVIEHLSRFGKQVASFRGLREELIKRSGEALRATSELLAKKGDLTAEQEEIVVRSARRRVAASFDDVDTHKFGWERYVFPPLSKDLLMGDILQLRGQSGDDASSFRVVLTPSCDLVPGRKTSVPEVLVASCRPFADFQEAAGLKDTKGEGLRKPLSTELNRDQVRGMVPLPGIRGVFPTMCVDVRKLTLVPIAQISPKPANTDLVRVASLDSPFREKLMWAFVQITGRPATPDFDSKNWIDEIIGKPAAAAAPAVAPK